jgi:hypothetical protein
LQELERQAANWKEGDDYRVIHDFRRERGEYVIYVEEINPPDSSIFSGLVGDCLHNLSASLNFLAFDLALAYTRPLPEKAADEVEFPIFGDVDRQGQVGMGPRLFRKGAPKRIRSMAPGAQAEIEGLQPYVRSNPFTDDPLWRLYGLARFNRHRVLHPAVAAFSGFGYKPSSSINLKGIGPGNLRSYGGFVEGRTVVARIPVQLSDPSKEVYVDIEPPADIAFAKGTPVVEGEPMVRTLSEIYNHIVTEVLPPLTPYLTKIRIVSVSQDWSPYPS